MRTKSVLMCLVGLLLLFTSSLNAEMRTWTRNDGKTIEASYVSFEPRTTEGGQQVYIVKLMKADQTTMTVRAGMLCKAGRVYLTQILRSQGKPVPAILFRDPQLKPAPRPVPVNPSPQPEPPSPVVQPDPVKPQDDEDKGKGRKKTVDSDALQERLEKMKDAEALLRRILKGFPANCVTAEVIGTPKPVKQDARTVTVRVKVKLAVDETALAAFRKRLLTVLEEFKEEDWEESWKFERLQGRSPKPRKIAAQPDAEYVRVKEKGSDKDGGKAVTDEITVYVNTGRDDGWTSLTWRAFALDQMLTDVFNDSTGRHGECVLSIVSKAGDTIPLDRFPLDDERLGGTTPIADRAEYGDGGRTFFISSTFLRDAACRRHAPAVTVVRDVTIPVSLIDRLQALKCEMHYVSNDRRAK